MKLPFAVDGNPELVKMQRTNVPRRNLYICDTHSPHEAQRTSWKQGPTDSKILRAKRSATRLSLLRRIGKLRPRNLNHKAAKTKPEQQHQLIGQGW